MHCFFFIIPIISLISLASASYNFTIFQATACNPEDGFIDITGSQSSSCAPPIEYAITSARVNSDTHKSCNITFVGDGDGACKDVIVTTPSKRFPADGSCHTFKTMPETWKVECG